MRLVEAVQGHSYKFRRPRQAQKLGQAQLLSIGYCAAQRFAWPPPPRAQGSGAEELLEPPICDSLPPRAAGGEQRAPGRPVCGVVELCSRSEALGRRRETMQIVFNIFLDRGRRQGPSLARSTGPLRDTAARAALQRHRRRSSSILQRPTGRRGEPAAARGRRSACTTPGLPRGQSTIGLAGWGPPPREPNGALSARPPGVVRRERFWPIPSAAPASVYWLGYFRRRGPWCRCFPPLFAAVSGLCPGHSGGSY